MNKSLNILVVDDEESMRDSCRKVLSKTEYNVEVAEDGYKGFEILKRKVYDIVILDLKMPGIDGVELLKSIKSNNPDTIVIVITGYATVESAVEVMKLGAYDFLPKPFTPAELRVIVKRAAERRKLVKENIYLRDQLNRYLGVDEIIGESEQMIKIKEMIRKVGPSDSTVLISGESGTGKDLVARAIHFHSERRSGPFVIVDCGSLVENLFESELFGHVKGSFTGAINTRKGKFELADTGTIFFDEIGNIGINIQGKLLRAIQDFEVTKVGSNQTLKIDVRVISATNMNLIKGIKEGRFREDLFYRLSVIPIHLPSLRQRSEDIPILTKYFLKKYCKKKRVIKEISDKAMDHLVKYDWPGNVRELQNTIERAVVLSKDQVIKTSDLFYHSVSDNDHSTATSLEEAEKEHILKILKRCNYNKSKTAKTLQIDRKTLHIKMKKYEINNSS